MIIAQLSNEKTGGQNETFKDYIWKDKKGESEKKYFINTRIFLEVAVEGLNGLGGRHIGRICIMVSLDLIFISVQRS